MSRDEHAATSRPGINPTAASLLGFLHAGPLTGWDLDSTVEATIGNFWNVTRSQIYRELHTLDDLGLVEPATTGRRARQPWRITPAGREAFRAWIAADPADPTIRLPLLLTVFFGQHVPSQRLAEIVEDSRGDHRTALEKFRHLRAVCRPHAPHVTAVVEAGIRYHETMLDWLDAVPLRAASAPRDEVGWLMAHLEAVTDDDHG